MLKAHPLCTRICKEMQIHIFAKKNCWWGGGSLTRMTVPLLDSAKEKYGDGGASKVPRIFRLQGLNFNGSLATRYIVY